MDTLYAKFNRYSNVQSIIFRKNLNQLSSDLSYVDDYELNEYGNMETNE